VDVLLILLRVVGDVAAGAAQGVGGPDDGGKACLLDNLLGLLPGFRVSALGDLQTDVEDRLLEQVAFLRLLDRAEIGARGGGRC
jgi:ABC-type cobalamin transport system ATPase subunit